MPSAPAAGPGRPATPPIGRDHILLQESMQKAKMKVTKAPGTLPARVPKPQEKAEICSNPAGGAQDAPGARARHAGGAQTLGSSRLQKATVVQKVVLDLAEDED